MRPCPGPLLLASLLACGGDLATTTNDLGTGEPDTGAETPTTGGPDGLVECAPKPLALGLYSSLGTCADAECDEMGGPWHGQPVQATHYDITLAAQCSVASAVAQPGGATRWVLRDCTGDQIPANATLALTWAPTAPLPLPLTVGQPIRLRHRAIVDDGGDYIAHLAWSLRDDSDTLLAFHSGKYGIPDPWLTEPLTLVASHQDCTPTTVCGDTTWRDQIAFRAPGGSLTLADGNAGSFTDGPTTYDAFVFTAYSGSGYNCGLYSAIAAYTLALVAR